METWRETEEGLSTGTRRRAAGVTLHPQNRQLLRGAKWSFGESDDGEGRRPEAGAETTGLRRCGGARPRVVAVGARIVGRQRARRKGMEGGNGEEGWRGRKEERYL